MPSYLNPENKSLIAIKKIGLYLTLDWFVNCIQFEAVIECQSPDLNESTDNFERLKEEGFMEVIMKRGVVRFITVLFAFTVAAAFAQNVSTVISITNGNLSNFYLSIGDYYHVPESRVVYVRDHYRFQDEELPVVFFLASRAQVDPTLIIDLRMRNRMSWLGITFHFGLTPEIYYVPVKRVGPPYGKAYGHYKRHKNNYSKVVLADNDVVNLVNLRFMSDYHNVPPEVIMDRRGRGEKFISMNNEFREARVKNNNHENNGKQGDKKNNKNNGRGKGNGKG